MDTGPDAVKTHRERLTAFMRTLSDVEARQFAYETAREINLSLQHGCEVVLPRPNTWPAELCSVLEQLPSTPLSLALPWQAYHLSRLDAAYEDGMQVSRVASILATIPATYGMKMPPPQDIIGPYAGSLLDYLAELISDAKQLLIVNPYWSVQGTTELAHRLRPAAGNGGVAVVMTRANLVDDHRRGLSDFLRLLHGRGFSTGYWTPKALMTNDHPLVHAKVVIADRKLAYIGSANLTDNGLNHSIEIGVALEGAIVGRLQDWLEDLLRNFDQKDIFL